jgi:hypothetical protein
MFAMLTIKSRTDSDDPDRNWMQSAQTVTNKTEDSRIRGKTKDNVG